LAAPAFGRRRPRLRDLNLVVDLGEDVLSKRWWRGVATLGALCAAVGLIAPAPFEPLPGDNSDLVGRSEAEQIREISVSPLSAGSRTGGRMAASPLAEPLTQAPDRPTIDL